MDTRDKIIEAAAVPPAPGTYVVGLFDPLLAASAAELPENTVALVLHCAEALLPLRTRAELVAALRSVRYVVPVEAESPHAVLAQLPPGPVLDLTAAHAQRRAAFMQRVHARADSTER